jgi:hypothetical protein
MKLKGNTGLGEDELDLHKAYDEALFEVGNTKFGISVGCY